MEEVELYVSVTFPDDPAPPVVVPSRPPPPPPPPGDEPTIPLLEDVAPPLPPLPPPLGAVAPVELKFVALVPIEAVPAEEPPPLPPGAA